MATATRLTRTALPLKAGRRARGSVRAGWISEKQCLSVAKFDGLIFGEQLRR